MNMKQKIAELEKAVADAQERSARVPQPLAMAGMDCVAKEVQPRRMSKTERRAKLIAAHVALDAIRHDLGDYAEYQAINQTQTSIAAAIGRLELAD